MVSYVRHPTSPDLDCIGTIWIDDFDRRSDTMLLFRTGGYYIFQDDELSDAIEIGEW